MSPPGRLPLSHSTAPERLRDRAAVLAAATLLLFTPPALALANVGGSLGGVPLIFVYFFAAWAAVIAVCGILAARIAATDRRMIEHGSGEPPGRDDV